MSKTSYYGITIKVIKTDYEATAQELTRILILVINKHNAVFVNAYFEYDSLNRIHLHGTFMARKGLRRNLVKIPYTHIHIDPLNTIADVENWTVYIKKDQNPKNEIESPFI